MGWSLQIQGGDSLKPGTPIQKFQASFHKEPTPAPPRREILDIVVVSISTNDQYSSECLFAV